jgi:hypothetical protein
MFSPVNNWARPPNVFGHTFCPINFEQKCRDCDRRRRSDPTKQVGQMRSSCCDGCCSAAGTAWHVLQRADSQDEGYVRSFGTGRRCVSSPSAFLGFRAAQFVLMLSVLVWSFADGALFEPEGRFWFIYLTHWTLIIEVLYLGCALFTTATLRRQLLENSSPETTGLERKKPWKVWITGVLRVVALPASLLVRILSTVTGSRTHLSVRHLSVCIKVVCVCT